MEKECRGCRLALGLSMFTKQKEGKFGVRSKCKACLKKENYEYLKTKDGVATQIYIVQKISSKKRNMPNPTYTKYEFKEWLFSRENFTALYEAWVKSGYERSLAISVNRLDDYIGYSFDNIELMTWDENRSQRHLDVVSGKNNKQSKGVVMTNSNGNIVKTFHSIHNASRETGLSAASICNYCKGKYIGKTSIYRFRYESN